MSQSPQSTSSSIAPSLWRRFFAFLIDSILITLIVSVWKGGGVSLEMTYRKGILQMTFFHGWEFFGLTIAYFILTEALWSKTLGKKLLKLHVTSQDQQKPTATQIITRNILKPLDILLFSLSSMLLSPWNQTLGDRVAKTVVTHTKTTEKLSPFPITTVRKALGGLFLLSAALIFVTALYNFPKIRQVDTAAQEYITVLAQANAKGDITPAWEKAAQAMHLQVPKEKFQAQLANPRFAVLKKEEEMKNITFYQWKFTADKAAILGELQNGQTISFLLQKENGVWKVFGLDVGPAQE